MAAVTEYCNSWGVCDIYGLNYDGFDYDFEVKVSHADLKSELDAIQHVLAGTMPKNSKGKFSKHSTYLGNMAMIDRMCGMNPPNYFAFIVTEDLVSYALETLKASPYGLYQVKGLDDFKCVKKATKLHKKPVSQKGLEQLVRSLSLRFCYMPTKS